MKLSIIIPVYNVEKYVEKCLSSCINQTANHDMYEIVAVDDGSTDNSGKILDNFDWKGCSHIIIHQSNQGLSMARNNGVGAASGDYLWFVDSDDWIETNSVEVLSQFMDGCDVVCQRYHFRNYSDHEEVVGDKTVYSQGRDLLAHHYVVMAQLYIYKKDYFNNLGFKFKQGIYHEDTQFTPQALYLTDHIVCCSIPLYHYLQRDNSIMSTFKTKKVYDLIEISKDLLLFCRNNVRIEDRKSWLGCIMSGPILEALWLSKQTDDPVIRRVVKRFVNSDSIISKSLIYSPILSIKILGYISALCFWNLDFAYRIIYRLKY